MKKNESERKITELEQNPSIARTSATNKELAVVSRQISELSKKVMLMT